MVYYSLLLFSLLSVLGFRVGSALETPTLARAIDNSSSRKTCTVKAGGSNTTDDAPAILKAFKDCGHGGTVEFLNTTYYVNSVMNTTGLKDCTVDLKGTLLWSKNITYWLNHSMPIGYQNQSTVWFFGGDNVKFDGHGYGTLDGNGQTWYDFVKGISNYPQRPMGITIWDATNSVFQGLRFVQSQMWTMTIMHSHNVLLDSIYVNSTSHDGNSARNTDGADTLFSSGIHFNRWIVDNGDDSISLKANSTDILITNSTFYRGLGIAIGSIGQYKDVFETVQNVRAEGILYYNTLHAVYFKTWTGEQVGYPPNGGGGGLGFASSMSFSNLSLHNLRSTPIAISQCTTFSGTTGNCTSSKFQLHDFSFSAISGTAASSSIATFQCSAVEPCYNLAITDVDVHLSSNTSAQVSGYLCGHVENTIGFNCTGPVCVGGSATGGC